MKVLENIENYDPAAVICLSAEDDEKFVEELKRVVLDLIPLRSNKRKTRQYFDKYLRLDDNISEEEAIKNYFQIKDKYDNGYCPIPGEVRWPSRCFQPALFDVLKSDYASFGYIINILSKEIEKRTPNSRRAGYSVPDDIVEFSLKYDIEEIELSLKKISSPADRLLFLNATVAQLKIDLQSVYAEWYSFADEYLTKINIIIERETKRQDLLLKKLQEDDPFFSSEPNLDERRKTFLISTDYELDEESFINTIKLFLAEAYVDPDEMLNAEWYENTVRGIKDEFRNFVILTFKTEEQDTLKLINEVREWQQNIKRCLELAHSECKTCKIQTVDMSTGTERVGISEKDTLPVVKMLLEETGIICTGYIARLLYAHRDTKDVLFVAWGGGLDRFLERREELIHDFGKLDERKQYTDVNDNFAVFYERMADIGKRALLECLRKPDALELRERTSDTAGVLSSWLTQMQESYVKLVHNDEIPFAEDYFESYMWTYVACYCAKSVFITIEKTIAKSHSLSLKCDFDGFQYFDLVVVPEVFNSILYNFKCKDEEQGYADALNELFSLHTDKKEPAIPLFSKSLIGNDFISDSEWSKEAIKDDGDDDIEHIAKVSMQKAEEARLKAIKEAASERGIKIVDFGEGAHLLVKTEKPSEENEVRKEAESQPETYDTSSPLKNFKLKFYDDIEKTHRLIAYKYLHDHVGFNPGIDEYLYLKALIDKNIVKYPKFTEFVKEFPVYKGKDRHFSHYLGSKGVLLNELGDAHQKTVDEYITEIERLMKPKITE